jgi:hypothetical protein
MSFLDWLTGTNTPVPDPPPIVNPDLDKDLVDKTLDQALADAEKGQQF